MIDFVGCMSYGKTPEEHRVYMHWWRNKNRDDYNAKRLAWANGNRERRTRQARNSHLKMNFGITLEEQNELVKKQDNRCSICKNIFKEIIDKSKRRRGGFVVDHCHKTGKVRGLLCSKCNSGLGYFKDSVDNLYMAIQYVDEIKF